MQIRTFSIVAGTAACNARCPFCVSKMTVASGVGLKPVEVNWRNFEKACQLADKCGATTAMLTGKGEPLLFPAQVTHYLERLAGHAIPLVEVQTNGVPIAEDARVQERLQAWYDLGLTTVAISVVHWEPGRNREVYLPHRPAYIDLPGVIARLHGVGFSVRLAAVLLNGFVDGPETLAALVRFCREHRVEQLVVRPAARPEVSQDPATDAWVERHTLRPEQMAAIRAYVEERGAPLMRLLHGARVFDLDGQSVCLADCLTLDPETENIRQLIFFPDGHLRYDWQYEGAVLL